MLLLAKEEVDLIDSYVTVKEIAKKWEVKPHTIQMMCLKGKIKGAEK